MIKLTNSAILAAMLDLAMDEMDRALAERDKAVAEAARLADAIRKVLGNGADEAAWPPGTHCADALGAFVGRLAAERDAYARERDAAVAEAARLKSALAELVRLKGLEEQGGPGAMAEHDRGKVAAWHAAYFALHPGDEADEAAWRAIESRPMPAAMVELRDRAIDEHRAGPTEAMGKDAIATGGASR